MNLWEENSDVNNPWVGQPYQWIVDMDVFPMSHSSPDTPTPYFWTGEDIQVGDWIADAQRGIATQIIDIFTQFHNTARIAVQDVERFNTYCDGAQAGSGGPNIGANVVFNLNGDGLPIVMGSTATNLTQQFQSTLISRFNYRNTLQRLIRVNQVGHTFQKGDMIRPDANNPGAYELSIADANVTQTIGIVDDVNIPDQDWFNFRAFGSVVYNITPPLTGQFGSVFYVDPQHPGKVTTTKPDVNALMVYIQLGSPTTGILVSHGGTGETFQSTSSQVHKYKVTSITDNQTEFSLPFASDVVTMAINGVEASAFDFDTNTKVVTFDPSGNGYGIDSSDEVLFVYRT